MTDIQVVKLILEIILPSLLAFIFGVIMKQWSNHTKNKKRINDMDTEIKILKVEVSNIHSLTSERHDDLSKQLDVMDKKLTKLIERKR